MVRLLLASPIPLLLLAAIHHISSDSLPWWQEVAPKRLAGRHARFPAVCLGMGEAAIAVISFAAITRSEVSLTIMASGALIVFGLTAGGVVVLLQSRGYRGPCGCGYGGLTLERWNVIPPILLSFIGVVSLLLPDDGPNLLVTILGVIVGCGGTLAIAIWAKADAIMETQRKIHGLAIAKGGRTLTTLAFLLAGLAALAGVSNSTAV